NRPASRSAEGRGRKRCGEQCCGRRQVVTRSGQATFQCIRDHPEHDRARYAGEHDEAGGDARPCRCEDVFAMEIAGQPRIHRRDADELRALASAVNTAAVIAHSPSFRAVSGDPGRTTWRPAKSSRTARTIPGAPATAKPPRQPQCSITTAPIITPMTEPINAATRKAARTVARMRSGKSRARSAQPTEPYAASP